MTTEPRKVDAVNKAAEAAASAVRQKRSFVGDALTIYGAARLAVEAAAPILTAPLREELARWREKARQEAVEAGQLLIRADSAERRLGGVREALAGEIAHLRELAAGERNEVDRAPAGSADERRFHARATVYEYVVQRLATLQDSQEGNDA